MASLRYKTPPRPYQVPALKFLIRNRGGGLYVPMRWGKSWLAINAAGAFHLKYDVTRVLIICPNDVYEVWESEIALHCPVDYWMTYDVSKTAIYPDKPPRGFRGLEFHIRNFESVYAREWDDPDGIDEETGKRIDFAWSSVTDKNLADWVDAETLIVVDEAHHIGKPTPVQSRKTYQLARMAGFRIFMTGTAFHRKPFYVFGQFKFYDPSVFGEAFGPFKSMIAIMGGYGGYEVKRYRNLKWLAKKVKKHAYVEEYVPTTPPVYRHYKFRLNASRPQYDRMASESIIEVQGDTITAPIALTRYLRLAQIAGGWVKTESGKYKRVGTEKRDALAKRVFEYDEQGIAKVVVGCRFIPEIVDIHRVFKKYGYKCYVVHGGVPRKQRAARREAFDKAEKAVFITQFQPSREGIDLSSADLMVFYSLPVDYLTYDQFSRRIEKYDEQRTLLYEHLIGKNTVEELAYEALSKQESVAKYILSDPTLVERLTAAGG